MFDAIYLFLLRKNGKAIYGTSIADYEKPEWGRFTQKGNKLYAFLTEPNFGHISMKGFKEKIKKARLLTDGAEVLVTPLWNSETSEFDAPNDIFLNFMKPVARTYKLPDPICTVIEIELQD